MLWVKAWHVIFMVTWFAGLFYLPRLFVYHALTQDAVGRERFKVMERKLLVMTHIGGTGTAVFGLWLLFAYAWEAYGHGSYWLHAKLAVVLGLVLYHYFCIRLVAELRTETRQRTDKFYRLFNEIPALGLIAAVVLVIVRPF
ncbi:MAG: CopD family protein [Gammaproteobacteria bacterium]|nr:CopD family protein [Gammaproteobacteria bacterium]